MKMRSAHEGSIYVKFYRSTLDRMLAVLTFIVLALDSLCWLAPPIRGDLTLVVRLDAIGDFFLWMQTGAVDVSRYARSGGSRAALLVQPVLARYARESGLWDDVLEVQSMRFAMNPIYRLKSLVRIRRLGAARLIQPRASRGLWLEDAIARMCGIPLRIGSTGTLLCATESQRRRGNRFYDLLIPIDGGTDTHEGVRNAQFAEGLTGKPVTEFQFTSLTADATPATVVVALGAGARGRVWPIEKLAKVLAYIAHAQPRLTIILVGTESDLPDAETLISLSGAPIQNRVGATTLSQFASLLATSSLVICNESSAYHIAMAYKRKIVCLIGGGHYGHFVPYPSSRGTRDDPIGRSIDVVVPMLCFGCNWRCIYRRTATGSYRCVDAISGDAAIAAVDRALEDAR